MGSASSRQASSQPQPKVNRTKRSLLSLLCGASSSSSSQRGDCAVVESVDYTHQLLNKSLNQPILDLSPVAQFTSGASSRHSDVDADSHIELSGKRKCVSEIDQIGSTLSCTTSASVYPNVHVISAAMPQTSSLQPEEEPESMPLLLEEINEIVETNNFASGPIPVVSEPGVGSRSGGDDTIHVDVLSISSDVLPNLNNEITTRETRRNSRRTFLDAFSSRSPRRQADFPAILFTTEDAGLMGPRGRWLLDIGDDFFDDGIAVDSWHLSRRSREHRRNSRSEFWDRLQGVASDSSRRTSCPFDLHTDGSCSCELDEEGSALSSISRIVLLAEALFEVLDEIRRQPESFSLSILSVPAPASVVDSLPLRAYEKCNTFQCGDEVDQCHICLAEYEGGDKIRVLPCQHEYHMSCVDKWLKEVHGICPLCRGDVRAEGLKDGDASSTSNAGLN